MIAIQNSGEKLGKILPDVFISDYRIISERQLTIDFNLRDRKAENGVFVWSENKDAVDSLGVKIVAIFDGEIYNSATLNYNNLSERNYLLSIPSSSVADIKFNKILTSNKQIGETHPEIDENSDNIFYFNHKETIQIPQNNKFIGIIGFSYVNIGEGESQSLVGSFRTDIIKSGSLIPEAFYYMDSVNDSILDSEPTDTNYRKVKIANYKVKNDIFFKDILKDDNKYSQSIQQTKDISDLHISDNPSKTPKGGFYINIENMLSKYSNAYNYFKAKNNNDILKIFRNFSTINTFKILRRRKPTSQKIAEENVEECMISTKDLTYQTGLVSAKNVKFGIAEVDSLYSNTDIDVLRYFNFVDYSMASINDGEYEYGVEFSIVDGSAFYMENEFNTNLYSAKKILDSYINYAKQNIKNKSKRQKFSNEFYQFFKRELEEKVSTAILTIAKNIIAYNTQLKYEELILNLSSNLHPLSCNLEDLERIYALTEALLVKNTQTISLIQKQSAPVSQINNLSSFKEILNIKKWFTNVSYVANKPKSIGIEYLSYLQIADRMSDNVDPLFSKLKGATLKSRRDREIRKFFTKESSDINVALTETQDMPYAKYLSNISINEASSSYVFSPSFIDLNSISYDLVSETYDIAQNYFTNIEIDKNNYFNSTYVAKNKEAGVFYNLNSSGMLADSINKQQRTADDVVDKSILFDSNRSTQQSSKQTISLYKLDKLDSLILAKKFNIQKEISKLDYQKDNFFLNDIINAGSDPKIKDLPLQIKSAIFSQISILGDQCPFKFGDQYNNINFFSRYKINYCLLKKMEYLKSPYCVIGGKQKGEEWEELTPGVIKKAATGLSGRYLLCRMVDYNNENVIKNAIRKEFDLPIYNKYFLYDLETGTQQNLDQKGEDAKYIVDFKNYNVRSELIKTTDTLSKSDYFKSQLEKLTEIL